MVELEPSIVIGQQLGMVEALHYRADFACHASGFACHTRSLIAVLRFYGLPWSSPHGSRFFSNLHFTALAATWRIESSPIQGWKPQEVRWGITCSSQKACVSPELSLIMAATGGQLALCYHHASPVQMPASGLTELCSLVHDPEAETWEGLIGSTMLITKGLHEHDIVGAFHHGAQCGYPASVAATLP